jgi:hypothetical protein
MHGTRLKDGSYSKEAMSRERAMDPELNGGNPYRENQKLLRDQRSR